MSKKPSHIQARDRRRLAGPALRIFWNLARVWSLTEDEQLKLLGVSNVSTIRRWRAGKVQELRRDTLERISLLLGIYRTLHAIFGPGETADGWLRRPNMAPLFGGRSALELMLSGCMHDLYATRSYLRAALSQ